MSGFANYYSYLIVMQSQLTQTRLRPRAHSLLWLCMCRVIALAFACSVIVYLTATSNAGSGADGPEVAMEKTTRDFGDVFSGEELEQNFPVRNAGTKPLELSQKSALSTTPPAQNHSVAAAVWNPRGEQFVRPVAAMRAAPS
ncbi:MAG TPA: hypothetical protein VLM38_14450 [Blastocatellia bacterium]|nr:hypothetical protein [Blastocatellia bacterium]